MNSKVISGMQKAGNIACLVLDEVEEFLQKSSNPTCLDIEELCDRKIREKGGVPECIGYPDHAENKYKYASCISPNHVVCHGVPNEYVLQPGDIVNVDIVVRCGRWLGDSSRTFKLGPVSRDNDLLVDAAEGAMYAGMSALRLGGGFSLIGRIITRYIATFNKINKTNLTIIPDLCSHGIDEVMHRSPNIQHIPNNMQDIIQPYQPFTVEPVIGLGPVKFYEDEHDHWSLISAPKVNTAQFEHTVVLDEEGNLKICTARDKKHEDLIKEKVTKVAEMIQNPNKWSNKL